MGGKYSDKENIFLGRRKTKKEEVDSAAVSILEVILVELTNTVFVNSTNITTNIEAAVLSKAGQ